jgi:hypothetical protein
MIVDHRRARMRYGPTEKARNAEPVLICHRFASPIR